MARRYVEEALRQIDRMGGTQNLTLRELSRALGCAHTNAYNYFEDLSALVWQARAAALEQQIECASFPLENDAGGGQSFDELIGSQIDFALEHPGWYRAVWLEALDGEPPPSVIALLQRAEDVLFRMVLALMPGKLPPARTRDVAELFHNYLHGVLCKVIAGRLASRDSREIRRCTIADARRVLRLLVDDASGSGHESS